MTGPIPSTRFFIDFNCQYRPAFSIHSNIQIVILIEQQTLYKMLLFNADFVSFLRPIFTFENGKFVAIPVLLKSSISTQFDPIQLQLMAEAITSKL